MWEVVWLAPVLWHILQRVSSFLADFKNYVWQCCRCRIFSTFEGLHGCWASWEVGRESCVPEPKGIPLSCLQNRACVCEVNTGHNMSAEYEWRGRESPDDHSHRPRTEINRFQWNFRWNTQTINTGGVGKTGEAHQGSTEIMFSFIYQLLHGDWDCCKQNILTSLKYVINIIKLSAYTGTHRMHTSSNA